MMNPDVSAEIEIRTSRSGGKGGQNVNKVESRVEARFDIEQSSILSAEQKQVLKNKLAHRLSKEFVLNVFCSEKRTQLENKAIAIKKLHLILEKAFLVSKPRKVTKIPRSVIEKRMDIKKKRVELKSLRKKIF